MTADVKTPEDGSADLPSINALAVLALLATAPMTAYGIAEQIERALGFYWSVSRRLLLGEPKRLAARGLVEELPPEPGSRAKRRWMATDEGRAVLQRWLRRDVAPTELASELGLRVIFADQADLATLRRQLLVRRGQLTAQIRDGLVFTDDYIEGGGPFRARLPIIAATLAMLWEQVLGEIRAVDTMLLISETWTSTTAAPARADVQRMRDIREQMVAELGRLETLERIEPPTP